jgi:tRNA(Ile)-lysidine synthase
VINDPDLIKAFGSSLANLWPTGRKKRFLLAVSGGGDSMAMMHVASHWARENKHECSVITIDHGLRADSAAEAEIVCKVAGELGLVHQTVKWTGWDGYGNTQMQAREARYQLIEQHRGDCSVILMGHTLDDQAETFLLRLKRGSGVDGLAAMPAKRYVGSQVSGYWILRPFLGLSRESLRSFLKGKGHKWIEDPSNDDERFDRIEIRKNMSRLTDLGITQELLALTASHMGRARSALNTQTQELAGLAVELDNGDLLIDSQKFGMAHQEIQYRLFSKALGWVASQTYKPRFDALERILGNVLLGQAQTLHGCFIDPKKNHIRITREFNAVADTRRSFGQDCIWDNRWLFRAKPQVVPAVDWIVRALGPDGAKWVKTNSDTSLPFNSLRSHPGVFDSKGLVCVPNLVENQFVAVTFCTKVLIDSPSYY